MGQNNRRVRAALHSAAEALAFTASQAEQGAWRWCAIGACIALQGALVAALSGYDSAGQEAVEHPGNTAGAPRVASIQTLLRRAASADYLNPPERLSGYAGAKRRALALVEVRNRAVHVDLSDRPSDFSEVTDHLPGVVQLIEHLIILYPSFSGEVEEGLSRRCGQALRRLTDIIR